MNLKKRIAILEDEVKSKAGENWVVIRGKSDEEFERKRNEYLKLHPEPELLIEIVEL